MLSPTLSMDVNGDYRGPDHAVHRADGFDVPFHLVAVGRLPRAAAADDAAAARSRSSDFIRSLIAAREASPFGILPVWAYQGLETWCMIGYHAVPVIADAYIKGIRGFDADKALDGDGGQRHLRALRRPRRLHEARLRADRQGAGGAPRRRSNTPTTTGRIAQMAKAMGTGRRRRHLRQARRQLAQRVRPADRLHARAAERRQRSARRSIRRPPATAATTPKATPGSTPGTCRRTWPG